MTKVLIWCRHEKDNIIGIGSQIPWHVSSDFQRFRRLTLQQTIVVGKTTYESFPNHTLPNRKIIVLNPEKDYVLADPVNHEQVRDVQLLAEDERDLYICGGASVYALFMTNPKLQPEIVVDSVYQGELQTGLQGNPVTVTQSVAELVKHYQALPQNYLQDNIVTTLWLHKEAFIDQLLIKKIIQHIEEGM